jgi:hypothetical protein
VGERGDPGVAEALSRAGRVLGEQLAPALMDRLWVFPPVRRGRREHGLLVVSLLRPDDPGRRTVVTLRYQAEETGKGITFDPLLREEGEAPPDRLPRVIEGVVRRSEMEGGEPREIPVEGDPVRFEQWLATALEEATL